jgi:hypothetical protein
VPKITDQERHRRHLESSRRYRAKLSTERRAEILKQCRKRNLSAQLAKQRERRSRWTDEERQKDRRRGSKALPRGP